MKWNSCCSELFSTLNWKYLSLALALCSVLCCCGWVDWETGACGFSGAREGWFSCQVRRREGGDSSRQQPEQGIRVLSFCCVSFIMADCCDFDLCCLGEGLRGLICACCRSKLKEHMQYCVEHPEEISKLAKVKAQVSEVKGVMMENIEKVKMHIQNSVHIN